MGQETPVNIPRFVKQHIYFSLHLTNQYACHWSDAAVVLLLEWPIQSFRFECACVADIMPLLFQQPKIKGTFNLRRGEAKHLIISSSIFLMTTWLTVDATQPTLLKQINSVQHREEKQKPSATDKLWTKRKNSAFLSHLFGLIFLLWNQKRKKKKNSAQWESSEADGACGGAYGPARVWWKGSNEA